MEIILIDAYIQDKLIKKDYLMVLEEVLIMLVIFVKVNFIMENHMDLLEKFMNWEEAPGPPTSSTWR